MTSFPQLTRRTFFEADLIDRQKEIEERQLYQWEEREKEREAATAAGKKGRSSPATQRAVQQVKKTKGFFLLHIASSPSLSSYKQYCFNHFIVISFPILNKMDIFYSMF